MSLQIPLIFASALLTVVAAQSQSYITYPTGKPIKPLLGCPEGNTLLNEKCYKGSAEQFKHAPIESCPPGFSAAVNRRCFKHSATTTDTHSNIAASEGEFLLAQNNTIVIPATLECNPGFFLFNGECIEEQIDIPSTPAILYCPTDYVLVDNMCQSQIGHVTRTSSWRKGTRHIYIHSEVYAPVNIHNESKQSSGPNLMSASEIKSAIEASAAGKASAVEPGPPESKKLSESKYE